MASNSAGENTAADAPDAAGTKRSHSNRESTSQTDEDMAQIRKRVMDANKALRESGLAWSSGAGGAEPEDAEDDEHDGEEEDEDDTQNGEESTEAEYGEDSEEDDTLPPSPIAATLTHVWMVLLEEGGPYRETTFQIHGVFRHFNDALRVAATAIHNHGMGEGQSEGMEFEGPRGLREIAEKDGNDYSWRFEGGEGDWVDADLKRMIIMPTDKMPYHQPGKGCAERRMVKPRAGAVKPKRKSKANKFNEVETVKKRTTHGSKAYREGRKTDRLRFDFDKINLNAKTIQDLTNRFIVADVVYADHSPSGDLKDLDYLSGRTEPSSELAAATTSKQSVHAPYCALNRRTSRGGHIEISGGQSAVNFCSVGGKEGVGRPAAIGSGGVL